MAIETLDDLFHHNLRDIYYAEKKLVRTLPKLARKATSEDVSSAFMAHAEETEGQVARLETVFELIGKAARGKRCPAMDGLVEEGEEMIEETEAGAIRDLGLVAGAKAVEHYEIARYLALIDLAGQLGLSEAVRLFQETLAEEQATDEKLAGLASSLGAMGDGSMPAAEKRGNGRRVNA